jgi:hypothetical protein
VPYKSGFELPLRGRFGTVLRDFEVAVLFGLFSEDVLKLFGTLLFFDDERSSTVINFQ